MGRKDKKRSKGLLGRGKALLDDEEEEAEAGSGAGEIVAKTTINEVEWEFKVSIPAGGDMEDEMEDGVDAIQKGIQKVKFSPQMMGMQQPQPMYPPQGYPQQVPYQQPAPASQPMVIAPVQPPVQQLQQPVQVGTQPQTTAGAPNNVAPATTTDPQ